MRHFLEKEVRCHHADTGYKLVPGTPRWGPIQPRERGQPRESTPPAVLRRTPRVRRPCPCDSLKHANLNNTKKGQTGLETGRSAGGLVQNVRKPSHEWGEPLPIQAASPIGEVGARQLSPPSINHINARSVARIHCAAAPVAYRRLARSFAAGTHLVRKSEGFSSSGTWTRRTSPSAMRCIRT